VSGAEREFERGDEHQVSVLELFFDLVFVFAITRLRRPRRKPAFLSFATATGVCV
jgi:low temperature requirement protein LtrA